ncbi:MAG: hypothetical protein OXI86_01560 [Candidatus Poribacteria bacterium]|nr:hypothetical protein [Candidatus Poribacteria bacterium]
MKRRELLAMSRTSADRHASTTSSASSTDGARGDAVSTCLPASAACKARLPRAWLDSGIITASNASAPLSNSFSSEFAVIDAPSESAAAWARSGCGSTTAANAAFGKRGVTVV